MPYEWRTRSDVGGPLDRLLPLAAAAVVLVSGAVRVADQPYWSDEAATRSIVSTSWSDLLAHLWSREAGMGPYYVALWCWRQLAAGDAGLRWFSVLGGAVAAALLVLLARQRFGRATAIASGLVFVTNPFFLRYLTELRAYSWVMAGSIASALAIIAYVERPCVRRAIVAGVVTGLTVAVHAVFVLWLAAAIGATLVSRPTLRWSRQHVVAGSAAFVASIAPFVPAMLARSDQIDWITATTPIRLVQVGQAMFGGATLAIVLGSGVLVFGAVVARRLRSGERPDLATSLVLAMAVVGPVLVAVVSLLKPMLVLRYLSPALPFVCLGAVVGWRTVAHVAVRRARGGRTRARTAASLGLVPVVAALAIFALRDPFVDRARPEDPRAAVALVAARLGPGDRVVVDRPDPYGPLAVVDELERVGIDAAVGAEVDGDRTLAEAPTVFVIAWRVRDAEQLRAATERLLAPRAVERYEFGLTSVLVAER